MKSDDIALLHHIADQVDELTMSRFQASDLNIETKPDLTLVSDADRSAEQLIRQLVSEHRSGDAFIGEEFEATSGGSRTWIVDPIDGTNNFVRGVPVWATLLGIEEDGAMIAGLVSAPALGRRWWAKQGSGAFTGSNLDDARQISVSRVARLHDASISYSSLHGWNDIQRRAAMDGLLDQVWRSRAYGDFWSYMLVAEGVVDIAAEPELALYDMAALVPIVEAAGGKFTSVDGKTTGPYGPNAVATNGLLHEQVLSVFEQLDEA